MFYNMARWNPETKMIELGRGDHYDPVTGAIQVQTSPVSHKMVHVSDCLEGQEGFAGEVHGVQTHAGTVHAVPPKVLADKPESLPGVLHSVDSRLDFERPLRSVRGAMWDMVPTGSLTIPGSVADKLENNYLHLKDGRVLHIAEVIDECGLRDGTRVHRVMISRGENSETIELQDADGKKGIRMDALRAEHESHIERDFGGIEGAHFNKVTRQMHLPTDAYVHEGHIHFAGNTKPPIALHSLEFPPAEAGQAAEVAIFGAGGKHVHLPGQIGQASKLTEDVKGATKRIPWRATGVALGGAMALDALLRGGSQENKRSWSERALEGAAGASIAGLSAFKR